MRGSKFEVRCSRGTIQEIQDIQEETYKFSVLSFGF
jgi:hypothetical protein